MAQPEVSQTQLYEWLTGDDDSRMCDDIPDDACQEQPHNFFLHLLFEWKILFSDYFQFQYFTVINCDMKHDYT